MKIKFIGVGSAFTTADYYHSNMLIVAESGKKMLVDCGSDIRFSLGENGIRPSNLCQEIDAIYLSHLHADHIGGMEWLAFSTYFSSDPVKPKLFMEESQMNEMWTGSLRGGLECVEGKNMNLSDYFTCFPIVDSGFFHWEDIRFILVKMPHIRGGYKNHYSYGLLIEKKQPGGASAFISTDTQFQPGLLRQISRKAGTIFHDCETTACKTAVHAHYDELCTLPASLKEKMWLYHYQPHPGCQPEKDGFKGFVAKGQEFDFPC